MPPKPITENTLFYGDNLPILREHIPTESVDLIYLDPPTAPMETAAVTAGYYHSPGWNQDYRRIQILTIEQLLKGAQVQMPPTAQTFKLGAEGGAGQTGPDGA